MLDEIAQEYAKLVKRVEELEDEVRTLGLNKPASPDPFNSQHALLWLILKSLLVQMGICCEEHALIVRMDILSGMAAKGKIRTDYNHFTGVVKVWME